MNFFTIAKQTFELARQSRIITIGIIVGSAIVLLAAGGATIGIREPVIDAVSIGLWVTIACSNIFAALIPVQLICAERHNRAIYLTLAMPVSRVSYLVGRWLGSYLAVLLISISLTLTTAALVGVMTIIGGGESFPNFLPIFYFQTIELGAITALGVLFAAYTTPVLATLYTIAMAISFHFGEDVERLGRAGKVPGEVRELANSIVPFYPDMSVFDVRTVVSLGMKINPDLYYVAPAYGGVLIVMFMTIAALIFQSQDVK